MAIRKKDIAEELGVSLVTVPRVICNRADAREVTWRRVLERAKEFNCTPNPAARAVAERGRTDEDFGREYARPDPQRNTIRTTTFSLAKGRLQRSIINPIAAGNSQLCAEHPPLSYRVRLFE